MKHLQLKYNLLQILFWVANCAICGYVAVFLQYKGLTNTLIGVCTGLSCLLSMFFGPYLSGLVAKIKSLTIKKLMTMLLGLDGLLFLTVTFVPLPTYVLILFYALIYATNLSCVPFLSSIAMDYLDNGYAVNFGIARGFGSIAYASSAFVLGYLIDWLNPMVLSITFVISAGLLLGTLYTMADVEGHEVSEEKKEKSSLFGLVKKYPTFFFLLLGWAFTFAAAVTLATYLIDIVNELGGNTSFYGIAVFCMAASEMPVMAITPRLMRRYNSVLLIMVAAGFYILRNVLICFAPNLPILLVGMACQSLSYGLTTGVITYYVTYHLKKEDQIMGQTMIAVMTTGLGSMIGNVLGGYLSDSFGLGAMYVFACGCSVLGAVIIWIAGAKQGRKLLQSDRVNMIQEEV